MMNLEFIYLFSIRQHPATAPFLKVISIHGAATDSLPVKGNVFDDDCAPFQAARATKSKDLFLLCGTTLVHKFTVWRSHVTAHVTFPVPQAAAVKYRTMKEYDMMEVR